jgi:hypothetical protein
MRRGVVLRLPLALCAVLAMCVRAAAQHALTLDCCTVLNKLYAYMKVTDGYKCTASPAESTRVDLWLSYDKTHERIVFEDSTCDYNRNVYTLLVLSSIVLLMFFVGVQVVKNDETERKMAALEQQVKDTQSSLPMSLTDDLRFRQLCAVNLANLRFKA